MSGSARGRQRITRERIAKMGTSPQVGAGELKPVTTPLARDAISHAASIHDLAKEVDTTKTPVASVPVVKAASASAANRAIPARPPLRARAATLSDAVIPTMSNGGQPNDATLRQEDMDGVSSGLDKLAQGFEDPISEVLSPEASRASTPDSWAEEERDRVLPDDLFTSKKIKIGGAGRPGVRRRSLSTGGAAVNETGTGAGTRAAVRSNSIRRIVDPSETAKAVISTSVSRALGTDFGASLDQALQRVYDNSNVSCSFPEARDGADRLDFSQRTYRVQEQSNVVHASDGDAKVSTVGNAGDIAQPAAWRKLRKASDMHEHQREMKKFWAQDRSKAYGHVFVKRKFSA